MAAHAPDASIVPQIVSPAALSSRTHSARYKVALQAW
jgi:hypothetical protein